MFVTLNRYKTSMSKEKQNSLNRKWNIIIKIKNICEYYVGMGLKWYKLNINLLCWV